MHEWINERMSPSVWFFHLPNAINRSWLWRFEHASHNSKSILYFWLDPFWHEFLTFHALHESSCKINERIQRHDKSLDRIELAHCHYRQRLPIWKSAMSYLLLLCRQTVHPNGKRSNRVTSTNVVISCNRSNLKILNLNSILQTNWKCRVSMKITALWWGWIDVCRWMNTTITAMSQERNLFRNFSLKFIHLV